MGVEPPSKNEKWYNRIYEALIGLTGFGVLLRTIKAVLIAASVLASIIAKPLWIFTGGVVVIVLGLAAVGFGLRLCVTAYNLGESPSGGSLVSIPPSPPPSPVPSATRAMTAAPRRTDAAATVSRKRSLSEKLPTNTGDETGGRPQPPTETPQPSAPPPTSHHASRQTTHPALPTATPSASPYHPQSSSGLSTSATSTPTEPQVAQSETAPPPLAPRWLPIGKQVDVLWSFIVKTPEAFQPDGIWVSQLVQLVNAGDYQGTQFAPDTVNFIDALYALQSQGKVTILETGRRDYHPNYYSVVFNVDVRFRAIAAPSPAPQNAPT